MKRLTTALIAGAAVSTLAYASASALFVDGGTIQAGQDTELRCDNSGVKASWGLETDDNSVRFVRISDVAVQCEGKKMFVKVNGGPTMSKTIGATGQETFNFNAPYPTPESIENIKIWIEG